MANAGYYDASTNIAVTAGTINTSTNAVADTARFRGEITNIGIDSAGAIVTDAGGTLSHYATIGDLLTDIPLTSTGQVIDTSRINKWFFGAGYGRI